MNRRTFVGLTAGAAVCATGDFTTATRAESKPLDAARMLEVTRVPGVAIGLTISDRTWAGFIQLLINLSFSCVGSLCLQWCR
jgi:hypothetical protein